MLYEIRNFSLFMKNTKTKICVIQNTPKNPCFFHVKKFLLIFLVEKKTFLQHFVFSKKEEEKNVIQIQRSQNSLSIITN